MIARHVVVIGIVLLLLNSPAVRAKEEEAARPFDRVRTRLELLREMDRQIDESAARAHLEARLLLDRTLPLPYLGVDADPVAEGMSITKVYALTGAEQAGLAVGDVILSVDGRPTPSPQALGLAIRTHDVGDVLHFTIRRGAQTQSFETPLGRRPEEDEDEDEQFPAYALRPEIAGAARAFDFEAGAAGEAVRGLQGVLGGHGRLGRYVLGREGAAGFLRQEDDDPTGIRFPMALVEEFWAPDVVVRVRFRLVGGRQDQAAGVVVRLSDSANYIVARVNAVEGDLRIFRTAHGLRRTLPQARGRVSVGEGEWHLLEVRAEGARITARVDEGEEVVGYDTYLRGGRVGLWTKSDSRSDFDDLRAEPLTPGK